MGLFDKIAKREKGSSDKAPMVEAKGCHAVVDSSGLEDAIAERMRGIRLEDCTKIPFGAVAALGIGFAQMIPSLRTVSQTLTVDSVGYVPINTLPGETLKAFSRKAPDVYAGVFKRGDKSVMAKFVKAGPQKVTTSMTMPVNPAMMLMAAMLVNVDQKLDKLQETQESILSFLEQDKQAEMQADLRVLTDSLDGYKHNWDNDLYKSNRHMKVLDIKQAAEKNILFYQSQLAAAIRKLPAIHVEQAVSSGAKKIMNLFANYRLALYLFGFSSFLEAMLLGNFREDYLNQVAGRVEAYNEHYQNQFSQCRDMIKSYSSASLEKQVLGGIGNASRALGKLIASAPVLSKGPVDEWLQSSGNKLLKDNAARSERAAAVFDAGAGIGNEMFIDSIRSVGTFCNHTAAILFDGDALYLATA